MISLRISFLSFLFLGLFSVHTLAQNEYYVKQGSSGTGTSFSDAFGDLQDALNVAVSGDKIYVSAGTYKPSNLYDIGFNASGTRTATFRIPSGIMVYGGFSSSLTRTVTQADVDARDFNINETILSGDLSDDDIITGFGSSLTITSNFENVYHVIVMEFSSPNTLLDGFTVSGGNANGFDFADQLGAGCYNFGRSASGSLPTIKNCKFTSNTATYGSSFYNAGEGTATSEASPRFVNCKFERNCDRSAGFGTVYSAANGRGASRPTFEDCILIENFRGGIHGQGFSDGDYSPTVLRCSFVRNGGSGIIIFGGNDGNSTIIVDNCIFWGHTAGVGIEFYGDNGGDGNMTVTNSSFFENSAGIVNSSSNGSVTTMIHNSVFDQNTYSLFNISANVSISNTLVSEASSNTTTYPEFTSGTTFGPGMIYAQDPLFTNATSGDFTLQPCSPAINAGISTGVTLTTTDAAGSPRIQLGEVDMGAFEADVQNLPEVSLAISPASSDENSGLNFIFSFTRNDCTVNPLTVNFSVSGTAVFNDDYTLISGAETFTATSGTVIIPAGQSSAQVVLQAQQDAILESDETIILTIENP